MNILCTICARGESKGVKNKNIKKLLNKPLILHTLYQAKKSKIFDKIVISSDSEKILNICKKNVDYAIKRPKKLATHTTPKMHTIKHALITAENYFNKKFHIIFDLDISSPLRKVKDIILAKNQFIKNDNYNLISISNSKKNPYYNMIEMNNKVPNLSKKLRRKIFSRQKAPQVYDMNASIYIWKRKVLLNLKPIFNKKTTAYIMPENRSIDIDSDLDFKIVEFLMKQRYGGK